MKSAILVCSLLCLLTMAPACPPQPVVPDGDVADAGPITTDAPSCSVPSGYCCRSCAVLASPDIDCPEAQPTANGASCEAVCLNASTGPAAMRWPDVSSCSTRACVVAKYRCAR